MPEQLSWDNLTRMIVGDLSSYLREENASPDLVIYSGSKGGAICGGIALANVKEIRGNEVPVYLISSNELLNQDGLKLSEDIHKHLTYLMNSTNVVLLIESTRQHNSPYLFLKNKCRRVQKLLHYAVVYVTGNNDGIVPPPGKFSLERNSVHKDDFHFPWYL